MQRKRIWSVAVLVLCTMLLLFYNWTNEARKTAHIMPEIPRRNIDSIVRQISLSDMQLDVVSEQTGINKGTINSLIERGEWQQILEYQEAYYAPIQVESFRSTPLTICEYVADENGNRTKGMKLADIQDGDILITKNSRFLGWRNGHAGLVVDAEKGLVLEAVMLGTNTTLCPVEEWEKYPSFLVLRLKEDWKNPDRIESIVTYAENYLVDIPYQLEAGVWERLSGKEMRADSDGQEAQATDIAQAALSGTHCAHLVWYAYKQVDIDLDSDGGFFVTPYDIQNSPYLEVVQSYGY